MATGSVHFDLKELAEIDMELPIQKAILDEVLTKDPFTPVPGIINMRCLGSLPSSRIRKGLIYRSGALNNLPLSSLSTLKDDLGIKLILDLRTQREITRSPNPAIAGVTNKHFDSLRVPSPLDLSEFVEEGGKKGYVKMYEEVLEIHQPSIRAALEWVRDEGSPLLFHCTAGKDRTGVLAAILLSLAGTPKEAIAHDFALTRIGIEPARELLLQMLKMWNKEWTAETPGMREFSQIKEEYMLGTLEMMQEKYGGAEGYAKRLGFADEDLEKIRKGLRGD